MDHSLRRHETLSRMNLGKLKVPLSWAANEPMRPYANYGDALSAVVVGCLAGAIPVHANFDDAIERIVGIGTIGHEQRNGILHFWGTGVDGTRNPLGIDCVYTKPDNTRFYVHALRGPVSRASFLLAGIDAPKIYGDPAWLLPRIWPMADVEKTHDLGIILHISELSEQTPEGIPLEIFERYVIPLELRDRIKIINTYTKPDLNSIFSKTREIISCRRIISASLHGMVIAETYGIPCAWFSHKEGGRGVDLAIEENLQKIDSRIADFYLGIGRKTVSSYFGVRDRASNWEDIIRFIDASWNPVENYDEQQLLEAFPLPIVVNPNAKRWPFDASLFATVPF